MWLFLVLATFILPLIHAETVDPQLLDETLSLLKGGQLLCNCSAITGCGVGLKDGRVIKGICLTEGGCVKTLARDKTHPRLYATSYNCVEKDNYHPRERPLVCHSIRADAPWRNYHCCDDTSFCASNANITLAEIPLKFAPKQQQANQWLVPVLIIMVIVIVVVISLLVVYMWLSSPTCNRLCPLLPMLLSAPHKQSLVETDYRVLPDLKHQIPDLNACINELDDPTSGTGRGLLAMVEPTVAREITLSKQIGEGRYGKVYLGSWKGDPVAVKVFSTRDEASYFREVKIFTTYMLRHANILNFVAADNIDRGTSMQLWVITEYHAHGSLYDFLSKETLSLPQLCTMARSIAHGLVYLHGEARTDHGTKPAIAHRDLKTKNVLVKSNLECAIGDLGLAIRDKTFDLADPKIKSGTKRYQPPEVLDGSLNPEIFDEYKGGDIYCLGLIIWEMTRRTSGPGFDSEAYELPYYDVVPAEPSEQDMREVVCTNGIRPCIPAHWANHTILASLSELIKESWAANQAARLTALRIKKNLQALEHQALDIV